MWGAIIGDLAGSIYEYEQFTNTHSVNIEKLLSENSFYSDDTILTIAILDAILNNDKEYGKYLKSYVLKHKDDTPKNTPYFEGMFSPNFTKWSLSSKIGTSKGNGAMMRISPVGYLFNSEEEVIENAKLATNPSHNSDEAIECAITIALIIYYARCGLSKEQIIKKLNINYTYKTFEHFNSTCYETIDNCLYAAFESNSFEEALKLIISFGGDTDTNACIVGSIAEALYGIDKNLIEQTKKYIPEDFIKKLNIAYKK